MTNGNAASCSSPAAGAHEHGDCHSTTARRQAAVSNGVLERPRSGSLSAVGSRVDTTVSRHVPWKAGQHDRPVTAPVTRQQPRQPSNHPGAADKLHGRGNAAEKARLQWELQILAAKTDLRLHSIVANQDPTAAPESVVRGVTGDPTAASSFNPPGSSRLRSTSPSPSAATLPQGNMRSSLAAVNAVTAMISHGVTDAPGPAPTGAATFIKDLEDLDETELSHTYDQARQAATAEINARSAIELQGKSHLRICTSPTMSAGAMHLPTEDTSLELTGPSNGNR